MAKRNVFMPPLCTLFGLALAVVWFPVLATGEGGTQHWVATWTTANVSSDSPTTFSNQTIREIVHTTIGGTSIRLPLSNTFGPRSIRFDSVFVGLQKIGSQNNDATLRPHSNHEVTFGGRRSVAIPEGAEVLSD